MRVTWETQFLGEFHKDMPEDEVLEFVQSLIVLGFTPEVTQQ